MKLKRLWLVTLSLAAALCMLFGLAACGEEGACEHDFDWEVTQTATCTTNGIRVGTCSKCGVTRTETTVGAHTPVETKEVAPTYPCLEEGARGYWTCSECQKHFVDEDCATEIEDLAAYLNIPTIGHSVIRIEAVEETCETAGNKAYYRCKTCVFAFEEENCEKIIFENQYVIPAINHANKTSVTGKVASCTQTGITAHYACPDCERLFLDEDCEEEIFDAVIPMTPHKTNPVAKVAATCKKDGTDAHYVCETCNQKFWDAGAEEEIEDEEELVISSTGEHRIEWILEVLPSCKNTATAQQQQGVKAHWECVYCQTRYEDEDGNTEISEEEWEDNYLSKEWVDHSPACATFIETLDPTCIAFGEKEHYECNSCGEKFLYDETNERATTQSNDQLQIAMIAHESNDWFFDETSHSGFCRLCEQEYEFLDHVGALGENCAVCNEKIEVTVGLAYEKKETGWAVTGIGTWDLSADSGELIIPDMYKGEPVIEIGVEAFVADRTASGQGYLYKLHKITSVVLGANVEIINRYAFGNTAYVNNTGTLLQVHAENSSLKRLEEGAFAGSYQLHTLILPEGLQYIGPLAFSQTYRLSNLTLPKSLLYVSDEDGWLNGEAVVSATAFNESGLLGTSWGSWYGGDGSKIDKSNRRITFTGSWEEWFRGCEDSEERSIVNDIIETLIADYVVFCQGNNGTDGPYYGVKENSHTQVSKVWSEWPESDEDWE